MRILFVEDDARVVTGVLRLARNLGHDMVHASSVSEARALLEAGRFDGVLADQTLPHQEQGTELMDWIAAHQPTVPRALTSGGPRPPGYVVSPPYQTYLDKPFGRTDLENVFAQFASANASTAGGAP